MANQPVEGELFELEAVESAPTPNPDNVAVHWLNVLSPLLIGSVADCNAYAEQHGLNVYYVAANIDVLDGVDSKTKNPNFLRTAGIVKVVKNLVGEAIIKVNDPIAEFGVYREQAHFSLPKMPLEMVLKLDKFFRKVDEEKHAEAIVLLTYDPTVGGSEGWGVLVPKQRNTAGSCDYEPLSVVDDQPDNAHIIGSVHSHPGMSAFASHTDIGDQANFDGLHITFGWTSKHKTEYYLELQMGGTRFTLQPEQVFCAPPLPEVDDDLGEWLAKVDKSPTPTYSYNGYNYGYGAYDGYYSSSTSDSKRITPPKGCPDIESNIVITNFKNGYESTCPVCSRVISKYQREDRRCSHCMCYVLELGEEIEDLIRMREEPASDGGAPLGAYHLRRPSKPIYYWRREEANGAVMTTVECLFSPRDRTEVPAWVESTFLDELAREGDQSGKVNGQLNETPFTLAQVVPAYLADEWEDEGGFRPSHQGRMCLICQYTRHGMGGACENPNCDAYKDYSYCVVVPGWWMASDSMEIQIELSDLQDRCILCDHVLDDAGLCTKCGDAAKVANSQIDAYGLDDLEIYDCNRGICASCVHLYESTCPLLRAAIRAVNKIGGYEYRSEDILQSILGCPGYVQDIRYGDDFDVPVNLMLTSGEMANSLVDAIREGLAEATADADLFE